MRPARDPIGTEAGFSLLELMIALVILAVITSQMFVTLSAQQKGYRNEATQLDLQGSARDVLDRIAFDVRQAGMLVPDYAGVASNDSYGGANRSDRLCVSDPSIFDLNASEWGNVHRLDPSDFSALVVGGAGNTLVLDTLDLDATIFPTGPPAPGPPPAPQHDFEIPGTPNAKRGIIVAEVDVTDPEVPRGIRSHCAEIENVNPVTRNVVIDPAPAGWGAYSGVPNRELRAVPAILYEVVGIVGPGQPRPVLERNGIAIPDVEDLQVEYWVDSFNPNGTIDGPEWAVHDLSTATVWMDLMRIRRIRLSLVTVSAVAEDGATDIRYRLPDVANRNGFAAGVGDPFPRKLFTASVLPRNLMLWPAYREPGSLGPEPLP